MYSTRALATARTGVPIAAEMSMPLLLMVVPKRGWVSGPKRPTSVPRTGQSSEPWPFAKSPL